MAKKRKEAVFIRELSRDLLALKQVLEKLKKKKLGAFQKIIADLKKNGLFYDSGVLELFLSDDEIPRQLSHQNINKVRILFRTNIEMNYTDLIDFNDPFKKLEFNIYAYADDLDTGKEIVYSLHLDRHIFKKGDNPSNEVHPMYHFQFGGNQLGKNSEDIDIQRNYGEVLFFDSPRITYHPMDFILGLDFLLSNFFPNIWKSLQKEPRYTNIIRKYQEYFMKPYYQSIANSFDRKLPQNWNAQKIYPQLIR